MVLFSVGGVVWLRGGKKS